MKKHIILGTILAIGFTLFGLSNKASAISLDTSRLAFDYLQLGANNYTWSGDMLYGDITGGTQGVNYLNLATNGSYLRKYWFRTPSVTAMGGFASIHFETSIAVHAPTYLLGVFPEGNLPYMDVINCAGSTGAFANNEIIAKELTYLEEIYDNLTTRVIRFTGNITMKGIQSGGSGQIQCTIGSDSFSFFSTANRAPGYNNRVWFDANPMAIEYTQNLDEALLQQQVYQSGLIIAQNQQMYEYLTDNTAPDVNISNLSGSAGWLPAGPVDSILTLPIQLAQGIVNVFTNPSQCTPLNIPLPWVDYTMTLPCVGPLMDQIGFSPIWATIGGIISAFIIYDTLKWLYKFVDDTLTLRENNSGLWGGL